jgi:hypothetical protein
MTPFLSLFVWTLADAVGGIVLALTGLLFLASKLSYWFFNK